MMMMMTRSKQSVDECFSVSCDDNERFASPRLPLADDAPRASRAARPFVMYYDPEAELELDELNAFCLGLLEDEAREKREDTLAAAIESAPITKTFYRSVLDYQPEEIVGAMPRRVRFLPITSSVFAKPSLLLLEESIRRRRGSRIIDSSAADEARRRGRGAGTIECNNDRRRRRRGRRRPTQAATDAWAEATETDRRRRRLRRCRRRAVQQQRRTAKPPYTSSHARGESPPPRSSPSASAASGSSLHSLL